MIENGMEALYTQFKNGNAGIPAAHMAVFTSFGRMIWIS
jgi:hypothetical protein